MMIYGATPSEWDKALALIPHTDILPVVSDPEIPKAENSNIKYPSKVPTVVGTNGAYHGVLGWVTKSTTDEEITRWREHPAHGICVVARNVHAIDIDIDDEPYAKQVLDFIVSYISDIVGQPCVIRRRENSSRCMVLFSMKGRKGKSDLAKHITRTPHGVVEYLFHRQHFVLFGTHTSGGRYYLTDGDGNSDALTIPSLRVAELLAIINNVSMSFSNDRQDIQPIEQLRTVTATQSVRNYDSSVTSYENAKKLYANDPDAMAVLNSDRFLGVLPNGAFAIKCPRENEHTTPTNTQDAAYFPAANGAEAAIKCFHTTHAPPTLNELYRLIDHKSRRLVQFEELIREGTKQDEYATTRTEVMASLEFIRLNKGQEIIADTMDNINKLLVAADAFDLPSIRRDQFTQRLEWSMDKGKSWTAMSTIDIAHLNGMFDRKFLFSGRKFTRGDFTNCVHAMADRSGYDSGIELTKQIPEWDGYDYLSDLATEVVGEESAYVTECFKYLLTAIYGRMSNPFHPIKADAIPVFVGKEGVGKSTLCRLLCLEDELFCDSFSFALPDADRIRVVTGKSIIEVAEMDGLKRSNAAAIKQFITRTYDEWVPKYQEIAKRTHKRYMLVGTTNDKRFINDSVGARRWLPIQVKNDLFNFKWIEENRMNFYAQAKWLYINRGGVQYREATEGARKIHHLHQENNSDKMKLVSYLRNTPDGERVSILQVLQETFKDYTNLSQSRVNAVAAIVDEHSHSYDPMTQTWVIKNEELTEDFIDNLLGT